MAHSYLVHLLVGKDALDTLVKKREVVKGVQGAVEYPGRGWLGSIGRCGPAPPQRRVSRRGWGANAGLFACTVRLELFALAAPETADRLQEPPCPTRRVRREPRATSIGCCGANSNSYVI